MSRFSFHRLLSRHVQSRLSSTNVMRPTQVGIALAKGLSSTCDFSPLWTTPYQLATTGAFHSTPTHWESDGDDNNKVSSKDELLDILSREHAEEAANQSTVMPEELKELQDQLTKKQSWKIVEGEDSGLVRLIKNSAGWKVQLSFHCQDAVESVEEEEENQDEAEESEPSIPVRFTVLASKAGQCMFFSCISQHGLAEIQSVAFFDDADVDEETLLKQGTMPSEKYQGPDFLDLAEDLQYAFHSFLDDTSNGLGINEDVAAFVAMYADYKEQTQYVKFLEGCVKLLK